MWLRGFRAGGGGLSARAPRRPGAAPPVALLLRGSRSRRAFSSTALGTARNGTATDAADALARARDRLEAAEAALGMAPGRAKGIRIGMAHRFAVSFRDPTTREIERIEVRSVEDSTLGLGFVCLSGFDLERRSAIVDPKRESLAARYAGVKRLHLHIYHIVAIEEIGEEELAFEHDRSKILLLPAPEQDGSTP